MNTSAELRNNLNLKRFMTTAWLLAGLFVFGGCAGTPINNRSASSVDARFRMGKTESLAPKTPASSSVRFYQTVIRVTLGSHCSYFPSDSAYAIWLSKRCGFFKTTLKSFERYSREFDAAYLGLPVMTSSEGQYFKDIPDECKWLG